MNNFCFNGFLYYSIPRELSGLGDQLKAVSWTVDFEMFRPDRGGPHFSDRAISSHDRH